MSQLLEKSVLKSARFVVREENSLGLSFPELQVNLPRIKEGNKKKTKKGGEEGRGGTG